MNLQEYQELGRHPLNQAALEQLKRLPGPYNPMKPVEQLIDLMVGSLRLNRELQDELAGRIQGSKEHRERLELISQYVSPEELRAAETVEEAEVLYRQVLVGRQQALGPDHPHTLTSLSTLARCLDEQEEYEEAVQLYQRMVQGYEGSLGADSDEAMKLKSYCNKRKANRRASLVAFGGVNR